MRLSPAVNRLKYETEVSRLREQQEILEAKGIFVLARSSHPVVEVAFVPRNKMSLIGAIQQTVLLLPQSRQPRMTAFEMPSLAGRAFKVRFDLSDYDLHPPSLEFRDFWTDSFLEYPMMFRALEFEPQRKQHEVLLGDHPTTKRPFLCMRGVREYHEHPQHTGDEWLMYRNNMSLFSIILSVWRVTVDLTSPHVIPHQGGVQITWVGQEKK
jgi:hypothetical protein